MLAKIVQWVVFSSKDPKKVSLSVKSFILALGTVFVFVTPAIDIPLLADSAARVIENLLLIVSAVGFILGAIRKIVTSIQGNNAVVGSWDR